MMIDLRISEAETILMNYWLVFVIFVLLKKQEDILSPVECHFLESIEELQELEEKN